jgi:hypothetical protein
MKKFAPVFLLIIGFSTTAQIPNADLENWSVGPLLDEWQTNSAPGTLPPYDPYTVRQSLDSYSGSYSADLYANGVFKSYMETSFPISNHPEKLSFYWKSVFAPCVNSPGFAEQDTLTALVQLMYNGLVVDSGYWNYAGLSTSNYQLAEVFFTNTSTQFDSCRIRFDGGAIVGGCGIVIQATEFYVDELSMEFFPNSVLEMSAIKLQLYPNPASSTINIDFNTTGSYSNSVYRIVDVLGQTLMAGLANSKHLEVDVSRLTGGTYTFLLLQNDLVVSEAQFVLR